MNRYYLTAGAGILALLITSGVSGNDDFYKRPPLFSTRPIANAPEKGKLAQSVDRFGPVGIGIELHHPAFIMKVKNVEEGSPAAATGKLKTGQIIETINGQKLRDIDPRIQLGTIITTAEATDGQVTLAVRDKADGPIQEVTVSIPVLGAYSETWPLDCPKSDKIVRKLADGLAAGKGQLGGQAMLFLLSTGEEKDLEVVRKWVKNAMANYKQSDPNPRVYAWHVGWHDAAVAEYYLRTGDDSVLPYMQTQADSVRLTMYHDGWGGRGLAGHHMGIAGTGVLEFLLLAKQCGVNVEEGMLQRALQHYFRFAGRGVNPYMDDRPESTFTDNGRNGRLAFAMAAAAALTPDGENSVYAQARDICAMKSFYSTSYMLHGHTGGGIGEVWRSAAMGMMVDQKQAHYREFMNQRTWFYDLSRRYNGSFGILGGGDRYDNEQWGVTLGLTYTAPRKKLCVFGAPRSKYAKHHDLPERPWGSEADDAFYVLDAPQRDGKVRDLSGETVAEETGVAVDRKLVNPDISDDEILKYIYHPQHRFREQAAAAIHRTGRYHLLLELLQEYVAGNRKYLLDEAASAPFRGDFYYRSPKMEELSELYSRAGVKDYEWRVFGPDLDEIDWRYHTFDPPEKKEWGGTRYRDVTYPDGMTNWFAVDFDAAKAGWEKGKAPFGQENGKLDRDRAPCSFSFCRHGEPMNTLWEKEVLIAQAKVRFPAFKEGHRYRLVIGGMSHVNAGEGFRVYVNGRKMFERNSGVGRREGAAPICFWINKSFWSDFTGGETVLAATSFMQHNFKTSKPRQHFSIWIEEMKVPPLGTEDILESAKVVSMLTSDWQALHDPEVTPDNPEEGKFKWDGNLKPSAGAPGTWTQVGDIASIEEFKPGARLQSKSGLPKSLTIHADGMTDSRLLFHTGGMLMDLDRNQALKMIPKEIGGVEYLFIEAGGFSTKHKAGWTCPLVVMKKKP